MPSNSTRHDFKNTGYHFYVDKMVLHFKDQVKSFMAKGRHFFNWAQLN